ncbi:phosphoribosylanthranilate isomerase [Candidatus Gracilibacteria bacterium]|nr:phosphoribosylanthranilate isomerase [Candidatus Gracilibacteria bacterium]
MPVPLVKICGIRTREHALAAAMAGADFIGLVFARSKRRVDIDTAKMIASALRGYPAARHVALVGLFVNEDPVTINSIADICGLDCVQLSGNEHVEVCAAIRWPVLKALRLDGSAHEAAWLDSASVGRIDILVDAHVPGAYGGTGALADWQSAAVLARRRPLFLAGGLSPENVAQAIATVRPSGVDVSSGVERDGVKSSGLIEAFIAAARSTS